jgi:hypothetical protein
MIGICGYKRRVSMEDFECTMGEGRMRWVVDVENDS